PPPLLDALPCVVEPRKPVGIQAVVTELVVEALDEGILHGLAWVDEMKANATPARPGVELAPSELRAVVRDDHLGVAAQLRDPIQDSGDDETRDGRAHLDRQALAAEVVDDIEDPKASAIAERVAHEVHGPAAIDRSGLRQRLPPDAPQMLP